ncbi:hypothetical protein CAC42_4195 [Sphaceloma murrayae]|uniref:Uncharacterized protein n=1 Tax=Sphaceloma murrayae TaxID=2082308 RepID=A0A2K1QLQ4_9PEZI|nr:hypothetical protein CAC42_4195 [Sphaceloma murrayae]
MPHASRSLNWSQRIALIRHTLHAATRSGDFTFFKVLQAQGFLEGVNYVGLLTASMGDEADAPITALDDLNIALAQTYEDAFKTVFTKCKHLLSSPPSPPASVSESLANLFIDTSMQKQVADMAIDKITNSVLSLIESQPQQVQEIAASVWIGGVAIVADAIEMSLRHMDRLDKGEDDFIRIENSWSTVTTATMCAITALKGVYNLMDSSASETASEYSPSRAGSFSAASAASGVGVVFRRLSNAFTPTSPAHSRNSSVAHTSAVGSSSMPPDHRIGGTPWSPISTASSTSVPERFNERVFFQHTSLTPIPPTPGAAEGVNPFEMDMPDVPRVKEEMMDVVVS